jgi:hypothetical protein
LCKAPTVLLYQCAAPGQKSSWAAGI